MKTTSTAAGSLDVEGAAVVEEGQQVETGQVAGRVVEVEVLAAGVGAEIRPVFGAVCQRLIVVSNCSPGSAHSQAASAISRNSSRARTVSMTSPVVRAMRSQSCRRRPPA